MFSFYAVTQESTAAPGEETTAVPPGKTENNMEWEKNYLTIIPLALMGSESIAHEAEGRMVYWLRAHEGERNNCFSKIQLVGQKNIETKHLSLVKAIVLVFKAGAFRY